MISSITVMYRLQPKTFENLKTGKSQNIFGQWSTYL